MDRGAWGIETLVLLACLKLAMPHRVYLLRGNHETATCTLIYGFKQELVRGAVPAAQDVCLPSIEFATSRRLPTPDWFSLGGGIATFC